MVSTPKLVLANIFFFIALSGPGISQSTISLADFGVEGNDAPVLSELEICLMESLSSELVNEQQCLNGEFLSETAITMSDIRNSLEFIHPSDADTLSETELPATTALPSIDMEILFDYNSSNINSAQYTRLFELADILQNDTYSDYRFVFIGHTDAKGGDEYNHALSLERANSVATFIASIAGFSTNRIASIGMGYSRLKDTADPLSASNRRVQLVLVSDH